VAEAGGVSDGGGSVDPFDEFELDEDFVRAATIVEPSAAERIEAEERRRRREAFERVDADRLADEAAEAEQRRWRERRRRVVRAVAWLVLGGLAGWGLWVAVAVRSTAVPRRSPTESTEPPDVSRFGSLGAGAVPTPLGAASAAPLGTPPKVPGPDRGYEFTFTQDGGSSPVTYDPCRPVHYRTSDRTAFPGADRIVRSAVEEIAAATGLQFVDDGPTDEAPSADRRFFQPERYGDHWAPVLIAWSDEAETPGLAGAVAGLGGSAYVEATRADGQPSGKVFVSGSATLDGPDLRRIERIEGEAEVRAVVLHELAHVVGLDHVNDRHQLMYPEVVAGVDDFGRGDRHGLAHLGTGPCHPEV
jgi:hypothetical protein